MRKFVLCPLALLLMVGLFYAAEPEPEPDSTPVVTVTPREPDTVNGYPDGQDNEGTE